MSRLQLCCLGFVACCASSCDLGLEPFDTPFCDRASPAALVGEWSLEGEGEVTDCGDARASGQLSLSAEPFDVRTDTPGAVDGDPLGRSTLSLSADAPSGLVLRGTANECDVDFTISEGTGDSYISYSFEGKMQGSGRVEGSFDGRLPDDCEAEGTFIVRVR